jgi:hypothetical protein
MSKRSLIGVGVVLALVVVGGVVWMAATLGAGSLFNLTTSPPCRVMAEVHVLSCTRITNSVASIYPFPGEWIRAQVLVTNISGISLMYASWGTEPYGWVKAQTPTGMTNSRLAPPFTGDATLIPPKGSATFPAWLPANTIRWRCGFVVRAASLRERAAWALFRTSWAHHLGRPLEWGIGLLPSKEGPAQEITSNELLVETDSNKTPSNNNP